MEITCILIKKIISLLIIASMGIVLVKKNIVEAEDSKVLSSISVKLIMPCLIIDSSCDNKCWLDNNHQN